MANRKRSAAKEAYWRDVVAKQCQSGKNVRAFCAQASVSEPSFYAWRRELRRRDAEQIETEAKQTKAVAVSPKLVPVAVIQEEPKHDQPQSVESQHNHHLTNDQHAQDAPIEIVTPGGFTLKLSEGASARQLEMVLGVLENQMPPASQPTLPRREAASC